MKRIKENFLTREQQLRDDKKNNELHLNDLNEKYALRKKKLIDQYNAAKMKWMPEITRETL